MSNAAANIATHGARPKEGRGNALLSIVPLLLLAIVVFQSQIGWGPASYAYAEETSGEEFVVADGTVEGVGVSSGAETPLPLVEPGSDRGQSLSAAADAAVFEDALLEETVSGAFASQADSVDGSLEEAQEIELALTGETPEEVEAPEGTEDESPAVEMTGVSVVLEASKTISAHEVNYEATHVFTASLVSGNEGAPEYSEAIADGSGHAAFAPMEFTNPGTYVYELRETKGASYYYDSGLFTATVIVSEVVDETEDIESEPASHLVSDVYYADRYGEAVQAPVFSNVVASDYDSTLYVRTSGDFDGVLYLMQANAAAGTNAVVAEAACAYGETARFDMAYSEQELSDKLANGLALYDEATGVYTVYYYVTADPTAPQSGIVVRTDISSATLDATFTVLDRDEVLDDVEASAHDGFVDKSEIDEFNNQASFTAMASDGSVTVTVSLDPEQTRLPAGVTLVVTPVIPGGDGYNYDAYMSALNGSASGEAAEDAAVGLAYTPENTLLYDIAFMAEVTGEDGQTRLVEVEPEGAPVSISMNFAAAPFADVAEDGDNVDAAEVAAQTLEVKHLSLSDEVRDSHDSTASATQIGAQDIVVEETDASAAGETELTFSLSSLSVVSVALQADGDSLSVYLMFYKVAGYYNTSVSPSIYDGGTRVTINGSTPVGFDEGQSFSSLYDEQNGYVKVGHIVKTDRNFYNWTCVGFIPSNGSPAYGYNWIRDHYLKEYCFEDESDAASFVTENGGVLYGEVPSEELLSTLEGYGRNANLLVVWTRVQPTLPENKYEYGDPIIDDAPQVNWQGTTDGIQVEATVETVEEAGAHLVNVITYTVTIPEGMDEDVLNIDLSGVPVPDMPALQPGDDVHYRVLVQDESGHRYTYLENSGSLGTVLNGPGNDLGIGFEQYGIPAPASVGGSSYLTMPGGWRIFGFALDELYPAVNMPTTSRAMTDLRIGYALALAGYEYHGDDELVKAYSVKEDVAEAWEVFRNDLKLILRYYDGDLEYPLTPEDYARATAVLTDLTKYCLDDYLLDWANDRYSKVEGAEGEGPWFTSFKDVPENIMWDIMNGTFFMGAQVESNRSVVNAMYYGFYEYFYKASSSRDGERTGVYSIMREQVQSDPSQLPEGYDVSLATGNGFADEFADQWAAAGEDANVHELGWWHFIQGNANGNLMQDTFFFTSAQFKLVKPVVEVDVTKVWEDADNADGLRPDSVMVSLLANGEIIDRASITAGEDGSWAHTFKNLAKFANNAEVDYSVREQEVTGYSIGIVGDADGGFTITNTRNGSTVTVPIKGMKQVKSDVEGYTLAGFEFALTEVDAEGNPVVDGLSRTAVSDENGIIDFGTIEYSFSDLVAEDGNVAASKSFQYLVTETKYGDSYEPDASTQSQIVTVTLTNNGDGTLSYVVSPDAASLVLVNVFNPPSEDKPVVKILKTDASTGLPLAGATLELRDKMGAVIESWVTTQDAKVFNNLVPGAEYVVHEVSAPAGYDVARDVAFTVPSSKVLTVLVADPKQTPPPSQTTPPAPGKQVPRTGDTTMNIVPLGLLAISSLAIGTAVILHLRKREV